MCILCVCVLNYIGGRLGRDNKFCAAATTATAVVFWYSGCSSGIRRDGSSSLMTMGKIESPSKLDKEYPATVSL